MDEQVLKFVIVGHVDHGKSTLIGRLLYDTDSLSCEKMAEITKASKGLGRDTEFAYILDHLEEERQQGITIETTQVFFKTPKREYVIIDAPGHVEFVKNMITGASQAEAAVLIIDVKEGIREQTKRHAYILSLLGISQVIVAINKMDLVDYIQVAFDRVKQEITNFLSSLNISPLLFIPISAMKGENIAQRSKNMPWFKEATLLEALDSLKSKKSAQDKALIFPVQDIYLIKDKRIISGRLEAGAIKKGDTVKILPGGQVTKVASVERFLQDADSAYAGQSIGITTEDDVFVERGNIICINNQEPLLTDSFSANVFWLSKKSLDINNRLIIRCATQEVSCKIKSIDKRIDSSSLDVIAQNTDKLNNLEVGQVVIDTKKPLAIKSFNDVQELGRFVFVQEEDVCAGGIIVSL